MFFVLHNVHTSSPSLYSFGEPCFKLVLSWAIKKSIKTKEEDTKNFKVKSEFIYWKYEFGQNKTSDEKYHFFINFLIIIFNNIFKNNISLFF